MEQFVAFVERVSALVPPFQLLVVAFSYVAGIALIVRGILMAGRAGDMPGMGGVGTSVVFHFLVGALFLALPSAITAFVATFYGDGDVKAPSEIFAYAPRMLEPASNEAARRIIEALVRIVQFIGLLGLVRGLFLLNQAPAHPGQGLVGRGATHIVGGALAVNMVVFVGMIEKLVIG